MWGGSGGLAGGEEPSPPPDLAEGEAAVGAVGSPGLGGGRWRGGGLAEEMRWRPTVDPGVVAIVVAAVIVVPASGRSARSRLVGGGSRFCRLYGQQQIQALSPPSSSRPAMDLRVVTVAVVVTA
ncbi:hypothetical protein OsI_30961 [Oryza sativa Indica Group]|uniref:Uncharacterized protein n=1 Tax=Oryza sativa subsp. indica TaxID=39946 RepID=B8BEJ9_ORYSI|nr:hypothetical protein OsI_30961 [Oryza sativa Indica Group]